MMQITSEEIGSLFTLFKQMHTTRSERYEYELFDQIRAENRSMVDFIAYVKTHYPEAIGEWDALNKIAES
jgi:hypothetical protein